MPIALLVCVILGGALLLFLGHSGWHGWSIDHSVKPLDLATLMVNVTIALLIQNFFAKKATDDRVEKDIVIDEARVILLKLRETSDQFMKRAEMTHGTQAAWKVTVANCRQISASIEQLAMTLSAVRCKRCRKSGTEVEKIKQDFLSYKQFVTNDPPKAKISADSIREEAAAYKGFIIDLKGFIFSVNSH